MARVSVGPIKWKRPSETIWLVFQNPVTISEQNYCELYTKLNCCIAIKCYCGCELNIKLC